MKRKLLLSLLVLLALVHGSAVAQSDIHFSQFYESALLRNPALTGVFSHNYKIGAYYRSQWSSITYPYQTMVLSGEYRLSLGRDANDFLSFGLLGYNDQAGDLNQSISAAYLAVNYNKSINPDNNSYLSLGFTGGYLQYSFDPSLATFNSQFQGGAYSAQNPSLENLPAPKMTLNDLGVGVNYNFSGGPSQEATYVVGVSGYHFTQPVFSYYRSYKYTQNVRWNVNAGMVRELTQNILLQMHANYAVQGPYQELIGGALLGWKSFEAFAETEYEVYAGVLYRYADAFIPVIKIRYKHAAFGLSYDVNTSSLKAASNMRGGLEITAFLTGDFPRVSGGYKKTICPRFN